MLLISLIIFAWRYFINSFYCFPGKVVLWGDFEVQQWNAGMHGRLSRLLNLQSEPVWWWLTLQVNTRSQPEKKGVSAPSRQTPTTPTSAPKSSPMQQHGTKAKVALPGPSLYNLQLKLSWIYYQLLTILTTYSIILSGCVVVLSFSQLIVLRNW